MKRGVLLVAVLGLVLSNPFEMSDIAKLKPVEAVRISVIQRMICVETDTGDLGAGEDLPKAFADLKQTASGDIYLETADRLLVSPQAVFLLPELKAYLRPGCNVCVALGEADMGDISEFLRNHEPGVTLQNYWTGNRDLPVLYSIDGRMYLAE
jgi:hypothetical protein